MRTIVLVMAHYTTDPVFLSYKEAWDETIKRIKNACLPIDVYFLYSKSVMNDGSYAVVGNEIITDCENNYWYALLQKVYSGFQFFLEKDYDLVIKTNLSTFMNIRQVYEHLTRIDLTAQYVYEGVYAEHKGFYFCSGADMLLNRRAATLVVNSRSKMTEEWTDDIFIGYILNKENGIVPVCREFERYDILYEDPIHAENIRNGTIEKFRFVRVKVRNSELDSVYFNMLRPINS